MAQKMIREAPIHGAADALLGLAEGIDATAAELSAEMAMAPPLGTVANPTRRRRSRTIGTLKACWTAMTPMSAKAKARWLSSAMSVINSKLRLLAVDASKTSAVALLVIREQRPQLRHHR